MKLGQVGAGHPGKYCFSRHKKAFSISRRTTLRPKELYAPSFTISRQDTAHGFISPESRPSRHQRHMQYGENSVRRTGCHFSGIHSHAGLLPQQQPLPNFLFPIGNPSRELKGNIMKNGAE